MKRGRAKGGKAKKKKMSEKSIYYHPCNDKVQKQSVLPIDSTASKRCWNCYELIPSSRKPIRVPYEKASDGQFVFQGAFCSLGCAKRNVIDTWCHQASTRMLWLNHAARQVFEIENPEAVQAAPPKQSLREFGGPLTRKEFRKRVANGYATVLLVKPLLTFPMKVLNETESIRAAAKGLACISLFEVHTANDNVPARKTPPRKKKSSLKTAPKREAVACTPPPPTPVPPQPKPVPKKSVKKKKKITNETAIPTVPKPPYKKSNRQQNTLFNYVTRSSTRHS